MQTLNWPNLYTSTVFDQLLNWPLCDTSEDVFDQKIAHFVNASGAHQWFSSCAPHFKNQGHTRDIVAGGIENWLVTKSDTCELINGNSSQKIQQKELPIPWMLAQLESIAPTSTNIETDLYTPHNRATPGWYGGLSYPFNPSAVGLERALQNATDWPDALFGFATWVITLNYQTKTATLSTCLPADSPEIELIIKQWSLSFTGQAKTHDLKPMQINAWKPLTSKKRYLDSFNKIQDAILAGETYQVNFTQCFEAEFHGSPLLGFLDMKQKSPSPYAAYWSTPFGVVSSHSPELFIETSKAQHSLGAFTARTKPIKGTSPRGKTSEEDAHLAAALQASEKNRAENIMIVDLLRNDLSKTAIPGSMRVPKLCSLESYASIHHLVSEIYCDIHPEYNAMDIITRSFPGGSITGAPKRKAMEIIDTLESTARDIYCGAIGFWCHPQESVFNIAIRTLLYSNTHKTVKLWAGGGIVKDSEATSEYEECFHKVAKLMANIKTE